MTREEETTHPCYKPVRKTKKHIAEEAKRFSFLYPSESKEMFFIYGAEWADKTLLDRALSRNNMTWIKIDRDENDRITDDCYYAMLDSLDEHPCFVVSADFNYCDYLIVTQLTNIGEWYDLVMANTHYTHYLPIPKLEL